MKRIGYLGLLVVVIAMCSLSTAYAGLFQVRGWADVGMSVSKFTVDPDRPYIYALGENNRLLSINVNTRTVEKNIFVGSNPTDLSIDRSTGKLYVATYGATEIGVVDLATFTRQTPIVVATTPYKIEVGRQGRLYYFEQDQWVDGHVVDTINNKEIAVFNGDYYGDIEMNSAGTMLYHGNSGSSSSEMRAWDTSGDPIKLVQETNTYEYPGGYSNRNLYLTADDQFLLYNRYLVDANNIHHILGTYGENIYLGTQHADYVFGSGSIWNGREFTVIEAMPFQTQVMGISANDAWLYLYDSRTKRLAFVQTPVPEPSSLLALASGLIGFGGLALRRRR